MSLIKKSDVKNHLSTRRGKSLLFSKAERHSDVASSSGDELRDVQLDTAAFRQKSGLRFYAVAPVMPAEIIVVPGISTNEPISKKPSA
jgi:hypothetical protein